MKYWLTSILAFALASAACGQRAAPPPDRPADGGPALAATMQFIQEKLSQQGQVGSAEILSNGVTKRNYVNVSDVMADPAACTLYTTEIVDSTTDLPKGQVLKPGFSIEDLHTHIVETDTIPFRQIEKITVEKLEDIVNQKYSETAHPEIKAAITPPLFYVNLWASSAVFSSHTSTTKGKQGAVEKDSTNKNIGITIRDEDTANRVAKAMTHAMELCGGGVTKKDLF